LNAVTARPIPGTHAQKVSFTALLLAQLAPASTVTDELGLAAADAVELLLAPLALDDAGAAVELLDPLLHARPVVAASAAMPVTAKGARRLLGLLVLPLLAFIGGTPLFLREGDA
jgi:hypothetical protein